MFSVAKFRDLFPILQTYSNNYPLVYFDNAATTQKPLSVVQASVDFYQQSNANVHRSSHYLSSKATRLFEQVRTQIAQFINAKEETEIIWTKGTTEAINLIAHSYGLSHLRANDEIVVSQAEHHANIVPWQHIATMTGAKLVVLPLQSDGRISLENAKILISSKCKIIAINHVSNVLGKINPVKELVALAHKQGAISVIDGAQAIAHLPVDVQDLNCDFYVFSGHKMYGPTGIGALYGKKSLLHIMPPYQFGGEMIKHVSFEATTYNTLPHKFEAGTPDIEGVIALGESCTLISQPSRNLMFAYEHDLAQYMYQKLAELEPVTLLAQGCPDVPIFSFTVNNIHHQDLAAYLDSKGIAVRSGHHCTMPLMSYFNLDGAVRVSLTAYNTYAEVDYFIQQLKLYCAQEHRLESKPIVPKPFEANSSPQEDTQQAEFVRQSEVLEKFAKARTWDAKHREIMLLAKQLPRLDKGERQPTDLISGCESKAWLKTKICPNINTLWFECDSDAKVIRGLMVIILSVYQQKTPKQIIEFDISEYFEHLGLMQHLSPSRGNGVKAIVERIQQLAYNRLK
ncbi:SufS family cysteine desulfurase [Thalassotalea aquiviva]|uniref:SufS family cysteine desulfurase n=1 Tax=Thalassotalea aquiviva TaxID=3242415 RepID=UPI00352A5FDA